MSLVCKIILVFLLKVFDATALIAEDEGSEPADAEKYSLSSDIFPHRYDIDLTPIHSDNVVSVVGRVIVQFHYNGTSSLDQIVLSAKSMNITRMRLVADDTGNEDKGKRKRREDNTKFPDSDLLGNGNYGKKYLNLCFNYTWTNLNYNNYLLSKVFFHIISIKFFKEMTTFC